MKMKMKMKMKMNVNGYDLFDLIAWVGGDSHGEKLLQIADAMGVDVPDLPEHPHKTHPMEKIDVPPAPAAK